MSMRRVENPSLVKKCNAGKEKLKPDELFFTQTPYTMTATGVMAGIAYPRPTQHIHDIHNFEQLYNQYRGAYNGNWTNSAGNGQSTSY